MLSCADDFQKGAIPLAPFLRNGDILGPLQILARQRLRAGHDVIGRALGDDSAAVFPCFRSDIDDIIGSTHGVFIVFDDDERIAQVAQALESFQELVVVPLVQADGRFVQDIEDADQTRPDLGGQADTLSFAAGQGASRPRQCQVV